MQRNPKWWNRQNESAWERVKAAFKRDWDQTMHDAGGHRPDTHQNVDDAVKQAAGKEAIPPRGMPSYEEIEDAYLFGFSARYQSDSQYPIWDMRLEAQLERSAQSICHRVWRSRAVAGLSPMNPETLRHSTAGGRELWGSQPAPLLVLARRPGLEITTNKNQTKNHLHKFVYKAGTEFGTVLDVWALWSGLFVNSRIGLSQSHRVALSRWPPPSLPADRLKDTGFATSAGADSISSVGSSLL
jgi:hypothetical protein